MERNNSFSIVLVVGVVSLVLLSLTLFVDLDSSVSVGGRTERVVSSQGRFVYDFSDGALPDFNRRSGSYRSIGYKSVATVHGSSLSSASSIVGGVELISFSRSSGAGAVGGGSSASFGRTSSPVASAGTSAVAVPASAPLSLSVNYDKKRVKPSEPSFAPRVTTDGSYVVNPAMYNHLFPNNSHSYRSPLALKGVSAPGDAVVPNANNGGNDSNGKNGFNNGCQHHMVLDGNGGFECDKCHSKCTVTTDPATGNVNVEWTKVPLGDAVLPMLFMAMTYLLVLVFRRSH